MGASMLRVMLVGNPNCGKSILFNALTGDQQRVSLWPGVTVEKKSGLLTCGDQTIQLTDLPGTYALSVNPELSSEMCITSEQVMWGDADLFINIIDASHLERHLYLTSQL